MKHDLLYLHGFKSSPQSHKARVLHDYMRERGLAEALHIPQIPSQPAAAFACLCDLYDSLSADHRRVAVVGSSLGGFYATALAQRYDCHAVLINPAVRPDILLQKYLGLNTNYHSPETWVLDASHIQQLRDLDVEPITRPERYLLLLQTGDETLDYRDALEKYRGCHVIVEQGGSHAFDGFERHLDRILGFCNPGTR
jgi:predicted esterase YcpF (UPF0227 family)